MVASAPGRTRRLLFNQGPHGKDPRSFALNGNENYLTLVGGQRVKKSVDNVSVDRGQLRAELRAEQGSDGAVGDPRRSAPDVGGPEVTSARVQSDPAERRRHRGEPGPFGHPRKEDIQGESQRVECPFWDRVLRRPEAYCRLPQAYTRFGVESWLECFYVF